MKVLSRTGEGTIAHWPNAACPDSPRRDLFVLGHRDIWSQPMQYSTGYSYQYRRLRVRKFRWSVTCGEQSSAISPERRSGPIGASESEPLPLFLRAVVVIIPRLRPAGSRKGGVRRGPACAVAIGAPDEMITRTASRGVAWNLIDFFRPFGVSFCERYHSCIGHDKKSRAPLERSA